MFIRTVLPVLSLLMLAAHFLRSGHFAFVVVYIMMIFLLFTNDKWIVRAVLAGLVIGIIVWINAAVDIAIKRMASGEPWARAVIIMAAVAAVTALAARGVRLRLKRSMPS